MLKLNKDNAVADFIKIVESGLKGVRYASTSVTEAKEVCGYKV